MGKRGPKPKLPEVERLEGNPGKRPLQPEGIAAFGEAFAPEHLDDDAAACFETIKSSMPPKVFARLDSYLIAAYAVAWSVHKRAAHEVSNPAFEAVAGEENTKLNAWIRILNDQAKIMASLGDRLGLDPKARAALRVASPDKPKSKFDGLVGIEGGKA